MTTRRISISRDGVVKLNGKATRWEVERVAMGVRVSCGWMGIGRWNMAAARAYLATLTDEELLG